VAYLKENRAVSVQELSRTWGLTRADIRYHLNGLLQEGVLERAPRGESQPVHRGRPEQIYRLSVSSSTGGNLIPLCEVLLDEVVSALPAGSKEQALRALAAKLAGQGIPTPHLTQRLNQAADLLSQRGYQARWEAHASGPRILLRRCPYAALLPAHPYLCTLDQYLLEQLTRIPLQLSEQINLSGSRPPACVFTRQPES